MVDMALLCATGKAMRVDRAFAHPTEGASEAGAISWCKSGPGKA